MSWFPPDDFEAPPPAYEEDFDRKVALAVETSLSIQESAPAQDDGEWEQWDEATFQANAAALERGTGASSSSSAPQPLSDRRPPEPAATKQKPSWYEEAGLGQSSSSQPPEPSTSQPVSPHRAQLPVPPPPPFLSQRQEEEQHAVNQVHVLPPEPEDHDEPLPPFTSVDGVPQEQVTVLSWTANSRTPSPLASPPMPTSTLGAPPSFYAPAPESYHHGNERSLPSPPPPASSPPAIRQSMPPPPRPAQQRLGPRPMTTNYTTSGNSQPREGVRIALPHVQFDPAVAYSNHRNHAVPIAARKPVAPVAASSFYNTSVSSTMMAKQGGNSPQPSRHLPDRSLAPDPRSVYDTNYHSPRPFRPYSNTNLNVPPPPPMPSGPLVPSYPQPSSWQQPQGGYNYYSR